MDSLKFSCHLFGFDGFSRKYKIDHFTEVMIVPSTRGNRYFIYNKRINKTTLKYVEVDKEGAEHFQRDRAMLRVWAKTTEDSIQKSKGILNWIKPFKKYFTIVVPKIHNIQK